MGLNDIRIGRRLTMGFTIIVSFSAGLLLLSLWRISAMHTNTELIVNHQLRSFAAVMDMRDASINVALSLKRLTSPTDALESKAEQTRLDGLLAGYQRGEEELSQFQNVLKGNSALNNAVKQGHTALSIVAKIRQEAYEGNIFDAAELLKRDFPVAHTAWLGALGQLAEQERSAMDNAFSWSTENYLSTKRILIIAGLITLVGVALIARLLTKSITSPLTNAAKISDQIAAGHLYVSTPVIGRDETARLSSSLSAMQKNLANTVKAIKSGSDAVALYAKQLASGNSNLSQRTTSQEVQLHRIDDAIAELKSASDMCIQSSHTAHGISQRAFTMADKGGSVVGEVVATMGEIRQSSKKVEDIVAVIDGIAFQTKILALNAAVEAARAGELGKGFAVVSAEVGNLAQRVACSAREIGALIAESVETVETSGRLVDGARNSMEEIVQTVQEIASTIKEIKEFSVQQRSAIDGVANAFSEIDRMNRENAILVVEVALASAELHGHADQLTSAVSLFSLVPDGEGNATSVGKQ